MNLKKKLQNNKLYKKFISNLFMFNSKEIYSILGIVLIVSLSAGLFKSVSSLPYFILAFFFVVLINILVKKITSFYLDSEIEMKIWQISQFGFKPQRRFSKPLWAGIIFPLVISVLSLGKILWMASLIFDVKPKIYRTAKRHGLYSYSEMTEEHIGIIAAFGILANLVFAIIGYFIGFTEFAKLNIYFAFFNLLPISDLDGNKIFFANPVWWSFLAAIVLVGLGYLLFLI